MLICVFINYKVFYYKIFKNKLTNFKQSEYFILQLLDWNKELCFRGKFCFCYFTNMLSFTSATLSDLCCTVKVNYENIKLQHLSIKSTRFMPTSTSTDLLYFLNSIIIPINSEILMSDFPAFNNYIPVNQQSKPSLN